LTAHLSCIAIVPLRFFKGRGSLALQLVNPALEVGSTFGRRSEARFEKCVLVSSGCQIALVLDDGFGDLPVFLGKPAFVAAKCA
jgi:hypothetical protein